MSWFALIDDNGINQGFYNNEFQTVPPGAKPVTDAEYHDWLEKGKYFYHWPKGDEHFSERPVSEEEKVNKARPQKEGELSAAASAAYSAGVKSKAVDKKKSYLYPTTLTDQQNMIALNTGALQAKQNNDTTWKGEFWVYDDKEDKWFYLEHNADQALEAGNDMFSHIKGLRKHYADLVLKLQEAKTEAQIKAIKW